MVFPSEKSAAFSYSELALQCDTWAAETGCWLLVITLVGAAAEIVTHTEFSINQRKKSYTDGI